MALMCNRHRTPRPSGTKCDLCERERNQRRGSSTQRGLGYAHQKMRRKFIKDHPYCGRCGIEEGPFELDHIIERQFGGSNDEDNYQLLCKPCHRDKGQGNMARVG